METNDPPTVLNVVCKKIEAFACVMGFGYFVPEEGQIFIFNQGQEYQQDRSKYKFELAYEAEEKITYLKTTYNQYDVKTNYFISDKEYCIKHFTQDSKQKKLNNDNLV